MPPTVAFVDKKLRELYGDIRPPVTDPWEMILFENVAYLVDDAKQLETFQRLRDEIGLSPSAILRAGVKKVAAAIAGGGMQPEMRAGKVIDAARIASDLKFDKKALRAFPSIGEPYADRILLFNDVQVSLAPDSNALRVLTRLGLAKEDRNYTKMYRSAVQVTDFALAKRLHLLLRRHGQELCKRSEPRCELCPLREKCEYYQSSSLSPRAGTGSG